MVRGLEGLEGSFFWGLCKLQSRWGFAFGWSRLLAGKSGGVCYRFVGTGMEVGSLLFDSD